MQDKSASKTAIGIVCVENRAYLRPLNQTERCQGCAGTGRTFDAPELDEISREVQLYPEQLEEVLETVTKKPCPACGGWGWDGETGVRR